MDLVIVTLEDEHGILEEEPSKQREREESEILFECLQAMLKLIQSTLDDLNSVMSEESQTSVRITLIDEEGIQKVEASKPRIRKESEIIFTCLQGTLLSTEVAIDKVKARTKARVERFEESQLS